MKQLSTIDIKRNFFINFGLCLYYSILVYILLSWNSIGETPPITYRLLFLFAFALPLFKYKNLFPVLLVSFSFIQSNMIATMGYFPNKPIFILSLCIILLLTQKRQDKQIKIRYIISSSLLLKFIILTLIINLFNVNTNLNGTITLIFILTFSSFLTNYSSVKFFLSLFPLACIISSCYFLANMSTVLIETSSGAERAFFNDPNMTALNIGFGLIVSLMYITKRFTLFQNKFATILHSINIILSIIAIAIIASRGAFIAIFISFLFIISKIKSSNKTIIFFACILIITFLYQIGLFNTIIDRLNEDDVTSGNGRLDIWRVGFKRFFNLDILKILFGGGDYFSLEVCKKAISGYSGLLSPHNQFIWYIFDYGLIGGSFFILYLAKLYKTSISSKNKIYLLLIYSSIGFMTLPPISSSIIYPCFLSFIIALHNKKLTI